MKTVLVVEDEKDLAEMLAYNLEKEGYRVVVAHDGMQALQSSRAESPDIVLLDLMIPIIMGTEVCKELRKDAATTNIPIIMLTARGEEIDRVVGFEVGADDYVVKPFSIRELLLRMKALLKRSEQDRPAGSLLQTGPLTIDQERHLVLVEGAEIPLTTIEYKVVLTLAERLGRVQSRETLLRTVWGYTYVGDTRTVDTHITRLRTKLGSAGDMIKTVRGFGYKMEAP